VSRRARRLDPGAATGLALTVALVLLIVGGVVLGVLAFVIRSDPDAIGLDASAAKWGAAHATAFTDAVLQRITNIGQPRSIIVLAAVLGIVETIRTRSRWIIPFLLVVVAGNGFITTTIKHVADRVRPSFNPDAAALGPSFPSGHSSWTAAFFAAAALVLASEATRRQRGRHIEKEQGAHPVEAETLPHLGEEERGQPAGMPEESAIEWNRRRPPQRLRIQRQRSGDGIGHGISIRHSGLDTRGSDSGLSMQ